jgi:hypothetical protein
MSIRIWSVGVIAFASALTVSLAQGKDVGQRFEANEMPSVLAKDLVATWNPQQSGTLLRPGTKVLFFGHAQSCDSGGKDGVTVHPMSDAWANAAKSMTGVMPSSPQWRWTPSGGSEGCSAASKSMTGDSFAVASTEGGFGLYTASEGESKGRGEFFAPFPEAGQNGKGANRGIEATFVAVRSDWRSKDAYRPWSSGAKSTMVVSTRQGIATVRAEGKDVKTAIQVKQQATVTLLNDVCMREPVQPGRTCQMKYLFHIAIARAGTTDWGGVQWFNGSDVLLDPGQGGLPVLQGPVPAANETVIARKERVPTYVSRGTKTQHGPFRDSLFTIEVPFEHFTNALRIAASQRERQSFERASQDGLEKLFGKQWNDPTAWVLLEYSVGQEVSNRDGRQRAFIGGNFSSFDVSGR